MITKHTPGPWIPGHLGRTDHLCNCTTILALDCFAGGIATIHVNNGKRISEGGNDAPPKDQAIANMHLMAAAPDLLEVLEDTLSAYKTITHMHPDDNIMQTIVDNANRVIAKARNKHDY